MDLDLLLTGESDTNTTLRDSPPSLSITTEVARWHARDVEYVAGTWVQLAKRLPEFAKEEFRAGEGEPPNPLLQAIVRQPLTPAERPIPVGVVSRSYSLAQHKVVIEKCLDAFREHRIPPQNLRCELGTTPLGEWINFRAYFPESFDYTPRDGQKLGLRLECFNSVDGSSRLVILLGWLRLVCTNGLIIGETVASIRAIHDESLDLSRISSIISAGLTKVEIDRRRLHRWSETQIDPQRLVAWVDGSLAVKWGKKAACRVYHICDSGQDVEIVDAFDGAEPSKKVVRATGHVPGATNPAANLYDVSQALSWLASRRNNPEERVDWQSQIAELVSALAKAPAAA